MLFVSSFRGLFLLGLFSWLFGGILLCGVPLGMVLLLFRGGLSYIVALLFLSCVGGRLARMCLFWGVEFLVQFLWWGALS